jgi:ATP phosphoribosyltransferase regulatory subunit
MKKKLLPVGFYDLLFDEAETNHKNINNAISAFLKAGYRLIKTPLVEFEGGFLDKESQNYFRTVDVISGQNLVFRNDITPQILRLLNSRLQGEKLPLKICYSGDVLCAKSEDLHKDRQQTQVGIEIIGCDGEKSDFEVIETLLNALKKIINKDQQKKLLIEFSLPDFLDVFLSELSLSNKKGLKAAIAKKDISEVRKLAGKNADIINKIMLSNNDLKALVKEISSQVKSQKISDEIKRAENISKFLEKNFPEIKVCFDLFGDNEFSYHKRISFDVFCGDFSYPIAKGGRYKVEKTDAIGATIYMNLLRKILL